MKPVLARKSVRDGSAVARPASIKIAAIFLLAASILWIGDFVFVTKFLIGRGLTPSFENPRFIRLLLDWGFILAMTAWAITTGIGILRLKPWARVLILALSATALYHFLGVAAAYPFLRAQGIPSEVWTSMIGFVLVYFGCGGLAALAMIEFASRRMDQVFQIGGPALVSTGEVGQTGPRLNGSLTPPGFNQPLSALVVGAWLLIMAPLALYQSLAHLQMLIIPLPATPLGFFLKPRDATVYLVLMTGTAVALGYELLRGKEWARRGTAAFCIFSIISQIATVLLPGNIDRLMGAFPPNMSVSHLPIAVGLGTLWSVVPPAAALLLIVRPRPSPPDPA